MNYVPLGSTAVNVSVIGLGTWSMGGRWWGPTDDEAARLAIRKALALGINLIDTADVYGFGHSEKLLGEVLGKHRKDIFLATKVGLRWNNKGKVRHDLSPQHIAKAIDDSLQRLRTDYVDLYFVHWPDPAVPVEATVEALTKCVKAGKVRFLGLSNLTVAEMDDFRRFARFDVCQPPLNMFERYASVQILPYCNQENLGVTTYSPLCRGLLSGCFRPNDEIKASVHRRDPLFQGKTYLRNLAIVDELRQIAAEHQKSVAQLAIAWVLSHRGVTSSLCGARKPNHLMENVEAGAWRLDHDLLRRIDTILMITEE